MRKLKKTVFFIISAVTFSVGDYKALLVGDDKGNITKIQNGNAVRPLASITKVMTSILVLEKIKSGDLSMSDRLPVSSTAASIPYGIKLIEGNTYTVKDLLKATIIRSSNNAAYVLGEYLGNGDIGRFLGMMNSKAREMGLSSLNFCSPHGLPPSYTGSCMDEGNARDLYKLAMYAVTFPEFLNISKLSNDSIDYGMISLKSTNALLGKVSGVDGLKTGYHKAAGSNIILTARRGGKRVIVVILGSDKAANRNALGEQEINNFFIGRQETIEKIETKKSEKTHDSGTDSKNSKEIRGIKVISKDELIGIVMINGETYGLYSVEDIVSTEEKIKPNLTYNLSLKNNPGKRDIGKVVGTFIAKGNNKKEYTGALILKELPK